MHRHTHTQLYYSLRETFTHTHTHRGQLSRRERSEITATLSLRCIAQIIFLSPLCFGRITAEGEQDTFSQHGYSISPLHIFTHRSSALWVLPFTSSPTGAVRCGFSPSHLHPQEQCVVGSPLHIFTHRCSALWVLPFTSSHTGAVRCGKTAGFHVCVLSFGSIQLKINKPFQVRVRSCPIILES